MIIKSEQLKVPWHKRNLLLCDFINAHRIRNPRNNSSFSAICRLLLDLTKANSTEKAKPFLQDSRLQNLSANTLCSSVCSACMFRLLEERRIAADLFINRTLVNRIVNVGSPFCVVAADNWNNLTYWMHKKSNQTTQHVVYTNITHTKHIKYSHID